MEKMIILQNKTLNNKEKNKEPNLKPKNNMTIKQNLKQIKNHNSLYNFKSIDMNQNCKTNNNF